jgi:enoyl-CoA hydratase/carnithine racemase
MTTGETDAVRWHTEDQGILRVELRSAPANALGLAIIEGLGAALDAADTADDVSIVVIESSVPGFFAAGADIKLMSSIDLPGFTKYGDELRSAVNRLAAGGRLSIAAIEGVALGGGCELAMGCTLRVAGAGARFGLPEVKLGLIPGAGGTQRLPRLVGRGRALDIMLTGRQVEASEAHDIGLVDRLVGEGEALDAALQLAHELLRSSGLAQAAVVRSVDAAFDLSLPDGIQFERSEIGELFEHGDGREGIAAFVEKRRPTFG